MACAGTLSRRTPSRPSSIGRGISVDINISRWKRRSFPVAVHDRSPIVVSKGSDFVIAHLLRGEPEKLLLISTGNISNDELEALVTVNAVAITKALEQHSFVELTRTSLLIHS